MWDSDVFRDPGDGNSSGWERACASGAPPGRRLQKNIERKTVRQKLAS